MRNKILIATLALMLTATCAALVACNKNGGEGDTLKPEVIPEGVTLATEHGVKAGDLSAASENTAALNKLIADAEENETVYIPRGDYYLRFAYNTEYLQDTLLVVANKKNLTLMGDGANLYNAQYSPRIEDNSDGQDEARTMLIESCNGFKIQGLNFGFYNYVQAVGTIVSSKFGEMTVKLDESFLKDGEKPKVTGTEYIAGVNVLDEYGAGVSEYYTKTLKTGIPYTMDGDEITLDEYVDDLAAATVGRRVILRYAVAWEKGGTVFLVKNTDGLTIKDVKSYNATNFTFFCPAGNANLTFDGLDVAPEKGDGQLWGSNVDAIHIKGMRGKLTITNSRFIGLGDDALNVHSRAGLAMSVNTTENTMRIQDGWTKDGVEAGWARVGDEIEFFNSSLVSYGTAKVTATENGVISFDDIPNGVSDGALLENREYLPEVMIDNTLVDGGRARAFLLQTENATVRNCTIKNQGLAGIIISPDITYWYEVGPSDNVLIENNTFFNVCARTAEGCYGAVIVKACHDGGGESFPAGVHTNLTIKDNTFDLIGSSVLYISATDGLTVSGNKVGSYSTKEYDTIKTSTYAYAFVNCTGLSMSGNEDGDSIYKQGVTEA